MHAHLKGKPSLEENDPINNKKKNNKEDSTDDIEEEFDATRPPGWLFHGWMAFLLFGPLRTKRIVWIYIMKEVMKMM
jgi:hypothetical protein